MSRPKDLLAPEALTQVSRVRGAGVSTCLDVSDAPAWARAIAKLLRVRSTGDRTWGELADRLVDQRVRSLTVDVYDTVLTRPVIGDTHVFWLVGAALVEREIWQDPVEAFVEARQRAAGWARVEEIYNLPALADRCRGDAATVESEIERAIAQAIPGASEGLDRLRRAGTTITFVSDMHLSQTTIRGSLADHGLLAPGDEVVVSCEVGRSKRQGTLFPVLRRRSKPSAHVGDDLVADVVMAAMASIPVRPITSARATPLESTMAGAAGSIGSVIAGAARLARLQLTEDHHEARDLIQLGTDVPGQCLTAFLLWIRQVCGAESIGQLMFLARDGELPLTMARAMPGDHWTGVRLGYLEGGRRTWNLAGAASVGLETWLEVGTRDGSSFLHQNRFEVPLRSLLQRVGLTDSDPLPHHPDLERLDRSQPLPVDRDPAWRELLADSRFHDVISERAERHRADAIDYLRAVCPANPRVGTVDVGWRGQVSWLLSHLLEEALGCTVTSFHFGGADVIPELNDLADIRRFAFDDSVAPLPFQEPVSCVELFTGSGRPQLQGFIRLGPHQVEGCYSSAGETVRSPERDVVWAAAIAVAGSLPARAILDRWQLSNGDLAERACEVMRRFWVDPTREQATTASQLCLEYDESGHVVGRIAAPYRLSELVGRRQPGVHRSWRPGSLRLTAQPLRSLTRLYLQRRGAL